MKTTHEQFLTWLNAPEGAQLEFKSATSRFDFEKLVDYCVALANEGGGTIILGVTDRRPRQVVGTAAFAEPGRTEAGLHQTLGHRIPVEEYHHEGRRVLIVHVPPRARGAAWQHKGRFLKRAGDDLAPMNDIELKSIFDETAPDFSAQPCAAATQADLSPQAIADFRSRWARKADNPRIASWDDARTLDDAELLADGRPTYAALILFGTRAALGRHLAQSEVVFEYRSSEASGPAQARDEHREGFFLFHDALWQTINLRNDKQSYQQDLSRYDIPTFDEASVREALLNAISHRDYRLDGSTFVRQYTRRLEIVSPGGFPPGITPENILDRQNPRNRRLAETFFKCGMIERSGQGMNLMVENAIRQGKPLPSFAGTDAHEVRLTLDGTMQNPAFVRYLGRLNAALLRSFTTYDYLALEALARQAPLTPPMRARLLALREAGAIESQGRGAGTTYMLSRDLYAALDQKGAYTRHRGLDRETNKALLLKHIRDNKQEGSPMKDLRQVLPALSERTIRYLLDELRKQGKIKPKGDNRWQLWLPVSSNKRAKTKP